MKKIIATVLLCVPFILLMACKTTVTKDGVTVEKNNSETVDNEAKIRYGTTDPNFMELGFHERLLNATSLEEKEVNMKHHLASKYVFRQILLMVL